MPEFDDSSDRDPLEPGPVQMPSSPPVAPETVSFEAPTVPSAPETVSFETPTGPPAPPPTSFPSPAVPPPQVQPAASPYDLDGGQSQSWEGIDSTGMPSPLPGADDPPSSTGRLAWIAAAIGALILVGGGAFFALSALGEDGGADTPEAAVIAMFDALSNEDFVTVATLIEPTERRTMVQPTFEILEELQRLGVLADDLDTASVDGIDLEYNDVEFNTTRVTDQLFQARIEGGETVSSFDISELPLGELVRSRLTDEDLGESGTERGLIESSDVPIAIVERDGRWYWSLWYTVGEAARGQTRSFPSGAQTLLAQGVEAPEQVANALFERALALDVEGLIGLLDPQEAAALYDYSPLFLPDAVEAADEFRANLSEEGYVWQIDQVEAEADVDGDDATVAVRAMSASLRGPNTQATFELRIDENPALHLGVNGIIDGQRFEVSITTDANACSTVILIFPDQEPIDERSCPTDATDEDALTPDEIRAFEALARGDARSTFAVRRVDDLWYLSPTTTMMNQVLTYLEPIEQSDLDALIGWIEELIESESTIGGAVFGEGEDSIGIDPFDIASDDQVTLEPPQSESEAVVAQRLVLERDAEGDAFHAGELAAETFDQHQLDLGAGEFVAVILRSPDFDAFLKVTDLDGELITSNDDFDGLDSGLDLIGPGEFLIEARALESWYSGAYTLEIRNGDSVDTTTNDVSDLGPITVGSAAATELRVGTDHAYTVELTAGQEITVRLSSDDGTIDPYLQIVRNGEEVASNDDYDELNSALEFTAAEAGPYQIHVSDYSGGAGPYLLEVSGGLNLDG